MNAYWQKVQHWSHAVGDFQARIILTFLYGILVLPTGLITRIGGELLERKRKPQASYWHSRPTPDETIPGARGQS